MALSIEVLVLLMMDIALGMGAFFFCGGGSSSTILWLVAGVVLHLVVNLLHANEVAHLKDGKRRQHGISRDLRRKVEEARADHVNESWWLAGQLQHAQELVTLLRNELCDARDELADACWRSSTKQQDLAQTRQALARTQKALKHREQQLVFFKATATQLNHRCNATATALDSSQNELWHKSSRLDATLSDLFETRVELAEAKRMRNQHWGDLCAVETEQAETKASLLVSQRQCRKLSAELQEFRSAAKAQSSSESKGAQGLVLLPESFSFGSPQQQSTRSSSSSSGSGSFGTQTRQALARTQKALKHREQQLVFFKATATQLNHKCNATATALDSSQQQLAVAGSKLKQQGVIIHLLTGLNRAARSKLVSTTSSLFETRVELAEAKRMRNQHWGDYCAVEKEQQETKASLLVSQRQCLKLLAELQEFRSAAKAQSSSESKGAQGLVLLPESFSFGSPQQQSTRSSSSSSGSGSFGNIFGGSSSSSSSDDDDSMRSLSAQLQRPSSLNDSEESSSLSQPLLPHLPALPSAAANVFTSGSLSLNTVSTLPASSGSTSGSACARCGALSWELSQLRIRHVQLLGCHDSLFVDKHAAEDAAAAAAAVLAETQHELQVTEAALEYAVGRVDSAEQQLADQEAESAELLLGVQQRLSSTQAELAAQRCTSSNLSALNCLLEGQVQQLQATLEAVAEAAAAGDKGLAECCQLLLCDTAGSADQDTE